MKETLKKVHGKIIKDTVTTIGKNGEDWVITFIFEDDSSLNIYMCENVTNYLDLDYYKPGEDPLEYL